MPRPAAPPSPVMAEVRRLQAEAEKKQRAEQRKAAKEEAPRKAARRNQRTKGKV